MAEKPQRSREFMVVGAHGGGCSHHSGSGCTEREREDFQRLPLVTDFYYAAPTP